jgi:hypothetical protein
VGGTFGTIELPSGRKLYTVEPPWVGNKQSVSCIPEGVYKLRLRDSGVVNRSSGGEFKAGWEIVDVPNRTFIMLHPGNWPHNFEGCIGCGLSYLLLSGRLGVSSSRDAFRILMSELPVDEEHEIDIRPTLIEYP